MPPELKSLRPYLVRLMILAAPVLVLMRHWYVARLLAAVSVALLLPIYVFGKRQEA